MIVYRSPVIYGLSVVCRLSVVCFRQIVFFCWNVIINNFSADSLVVFYRVSSELLGITPSKRLLLRNVITLIEGVPSVDNVLVSFFIMDFVICIIVYFLLSVTFIINNRIIKLCGISPLCLIILIVFIYGYRGSLFLRFRNNIIFIIV